VRATTPAGFWDITGDHNVYHIRRPGDGSSLATDDYELDVWLLTRRNLGVQYGAHLFWEPQGRSRKRSSMTSVTRHQQTTADADR